tara:strand:+ start:347 stop:478 length:132 start_codon:yes stop_codon:yes gene_type:complete
MNNFLLDIGPNLIAIFVFVLILSGNNSLQKYFWRELFNLIHNE